MASRAWESGSRAFPPVYAEVMQLSAPSYPEVFCTQLPTCQSPRLDGWLPSAFDRQRWRIPPGQRKLETARMHMPREPGPVSLASFQVSDLQE